MKRLLLVFIIVLGLSGIYGCSSTEEEPDPIEIESTFYKKFSLGNIIEQNEAFLVGRASISGRDESGKSQQPQQKQEIAALQIEPGDISEFMSAIRLNIESALTRDEIIITGQGADLTRAEVHPADAIAFSFRYRQGDKNGVINVWGVPGEGDHFTLITLITE